MRKPREVNRRAGGQSINADCLTSRPSRDGGTGRHRTTEAVTSSSGVENDDAPGEMNASWPKWFARKVRHVCDGAVRRPRK
jgi:hypothetical protein